MSRWKVVRLTNVGVVETTMELDQLERDGWTIHFVTDDGESVQIYARRTEEEPTP